MEKGKVRGIAALFAALLALVLAAFLCMGLPVREADAAESDWIASQEEAVASVTSGGETKYYKALKAALNYAPDGATVNVLKDTSDSVEEKTGSLDKYDVWLQVANKSIDIVGVGENRTLTATQCDWALYVVNTTQKSYTLTVENLNIVCSDTAQWPMEVANGNYNVTLDNVTLNNENADSSEAGFTVGGIGSNNTVTIKNSEILTGDNGKAIRVLNPVNKLTVDNTHLKGRAALYMQGAIGGAQGSAGSEVLIQNNSKLESYAPAYGAGREEFGTLVFEMSGVTVSVKDSEIVATAADGAQAQGVVFYSDFYVGDGNKIENIIVNFENTDVTVTGGVEITYGAGDDSAEGGASPKEEKVTVKGGTFNFEVPEDYLADGFELSLGADGSYTVVDTKETVATITRSENTYWYESLDAAFAAAQDGDTIVVVAPAAIPERIQIEKSVTLDLNGQTVTVAAGIGNRSALDVRAGTFTLIDSSENGTGVIDATGADSAPDEGTVPLAAMAEGATVIVRSGKIIVNTNSESCLFAGFGGVVYIYGGTFINECTEPFYWDKTSPALAVNVHDNAAYEDGTQGMIISGGTFVGRNPLLGDTNGKITGSYLAKNAVVALAADGSFTAYPSSDAVPAGAGTVYTTDAEGKTVATVYSEEALVAAVTGDSEFADNNYDVVRLGKSLTQSIEVPQGRTLTLDLNGFTLTNTAGQHTIINNGTLTVIDSSAEKTGTVTNVTSGKAAFYNGENATATLSGGTFTRTAANNHYVIQNHGTMDINDGVTMLQPSKSSSGIASGWYTPGDESQRTYLTINGGTFASNGITVKNDEINELIINGGTFDNVDGYLANQSVQNWAIGTIAGGTFYSNIYSWAYENDSGDVVRGNLTISGSDVVVRGNIEAYYLSNSGAQIIDESGEVLVEEGMFYNPVRKSYLSETSALSYNAESGTYSIVASEEPQAQIERGDSVYTFATLADAIAVAEDGDTVLLLGNVTQSITIGAEQNLTLDLNGFTLTNTAGQHTIINNGTLTIAGSGTVDNVSNGHGALVNYGTATLLGGTYTRSAEAGTDSGPNGNSWYVIDNNKGMLTICAGATVSSSSAWSSMIRNVGGADRNATLLIEGGAFNGGLNTVKNDDYGMLTIQGGEFTNTAQHVIMNWSTAVIEGGTFTPSDEASSAVWSGTWYLPEDAGFVQGKTVIKGGTFNGAISEGVGEGAPNQTSDGVDYDVSGGTFTQPVDEEYFADGFELSLGADGSYIVVETEKTVATITRGEYTYWFESLDAAFAAVEDGDTVVLLADVSFAETLVIDQTITLDLAGNVLTYTGAAGSYAIVVTADDVTIEGEDASVVSSGSGICVEETQNTTIAGIGIEITAANETEFGIVINGAQVTVQGVTLISTANGIKVNEGSVLALNDSSVSLTVQTNLELIALEVVKDVDGADPDPAQVTVNDSTITAVTAEGATGTRANGIFIEGTYEADREGAAAAEDSTYNRLTLNRSQVTARAEGITGNGAQHGTLIEIVDSSVESTNGVAVYHPQVGTLTVSGTSEILGCSGIEMRAGSLTIADDTVSVTATDPFMESPLSSGFRFAGVALGVSRYFAEESTGVTLNITGGTYTATNAEGYAFFEKVDAAHAPDVTPENEGNIKISLAGGTYDGAVAATDAKSFISGGKYAENPAKELFAEGLEGAYYGASGYYEVIESVSDDLGALLTAQTNAQADVRGYAASNGMSWTYVQELSANAESALQAQAAALLAAYTDITTATNEYGVAQARLAAIDAVDALISAFDALKEAAIGEIDAEAGEDVVVPTATYAAIYAAETEAELAALKAYALAEIGDIRTYRGQINGIIEDLTDAQSGLLAQIGKLETLVDDTTGTLAAMQTSLEQKIAAVQTAVDACATSSEIGQLKTDLQTAITEAVNGLKNTLVGENGTSGVIGGLQTALSNANTALDQLTGALLNSAKDGLADSITSAQNNINSILQGIASLATSEDVDAALAAILEDLAAVQTAVDSIADSVSASTAVEEAKTDALDEIRTWLNGYLDDIIGGDTAQAGIAVQSVAYTEETTDGEIYGKLTQAFSEENANLVLRYYNEALAAIDAATTVSEVTTAVSTFRAQVASVEAAAQNTPGLTGVYVLLAIVLVLIIVACIIMLVKGRREVAEQAEPAAEPVQKAQPEEAPAAAEEAPAEEVREAQPEPQPEPAQEAPAQPEAEEDDDKEKIVIAANVRSFSEAYMDLDEEQRALFGKVKDYALAKEGAVEVRQSGGLCIKRDGKQIVKLTVRRNMPVALFLLENEMLKDFRRSAKSEAKLKVRATELVIRDEEDLETAYTMVDLSVDQIEKDIEAAKERRREARRQRRLQRQAEEAAAKAQADEAAAEQAPAEDAPASDEGGKE